MMPILSSRPATPTAWSAYPLVATGDTDGMVGLWRARPADRAATLQATGAATNLRVCRAIFEVVPLLPFPDAGVWAPDVVCRR
jgi:hypothetical protein